ncbi:hypothetical protein N7453_011999 [Penicillium expansum]|nr:hypothetical protein N7453_011999 [Penicillium expansum]
MSIVTIASDRSSDIEVITSQPADGLLEKSHQPTPISTISLTRPGPTQRHDESGTSIITTGSNNGSDIEFVRTSRPVAALTFLWSP